LFLFPSLIKLINTKEVEIKTILIEIFETISEEIGVTNIKIKNQ